MLSSEMSDLSDYKAFVSDISGKNCQPYDDGSQAQDARLRQALRESVTITSDGEPTLIAMSVEEYQRLRGTAARTKCQSARKPDPSIQPTPPFARVGVDQPEWVGAN